MMSLQQSLKMPVSNLSTTRVTRSMTRFMPYTFVSLERTKRVKKVKNDSMPAPPPPTSMAPPTPASISPPPPHTRSISSDSTNSDSEDLSSERAQLELLRRELLKDQLWLEEEKMRLKRLKYEVEEERSILEERERQCIERDIVSAQRLTLSLEIEERNAETARGFQEREDRIEEREEAVQTREEKAEEEWRKIAVEQRRLAKKKEHMDYLHLYFEGELWNKKEECKEKDVIIKKLQETLQKKEMVKEITEIKESCTGLCMCLMQVSSDESEVEDDIVPPSGCWSPTQTMAPQRKGILKSAQWFIQRERQQHNKRVRFSTVTVFEAD